ncbi:Integrase, catalytic core [Gossypium australe]|uniref:Integrase, catalytic core n=1 Tax=Gossypium australe TaxID=47621 RepID=A0A5B6UUD0_9ROSI|nr:Integrase, catalytic core [Gossypium australe]
MFLGHVVSSEGICVDSKKLRLFWTRKNPRTSMKFEVSLDWSAIIASFSLIASPMTKLLRKRTPSKWMRSNRKVLKMPVSIQPKSGKDYVVYSDASYTGLSCVLMQDNKRQLKPHEHNYPTHDLKLVVVVFAIKIWRHYLYGEKCIIYTNKSLNYLLNQNLVENYDCAIVYHLGKENILVDALSRKSMIDLRAVFTKLSLTGDGGLLADLQSVDASLAPRLRQVEEGKTIDFRFNYDGVLCFCGGYYVLNDRHLR